MGSDPFSKPSTFVMNPNGHDLEFQGRCIDVEAFLRSRHRDRPVVTIDPGHGVVRLVTPKDGKPAYYDYDSGAKTAGHQEADINLALAKDMARALNAQGFDVIMTHGKNGLKAGDGFSSRLQAIVETSYTISVHTDERPASIPGARVISFARNPAINVEDGEKPGAQPVPKKMNDIAGAEGSDRLRAFLAKNRSGHDLLANQYVYRDHLIVLNPDHIGKGRYSVLIEAGNMMHGGDRAQLLNPRWRTAFAQEIAGDLRAFHIQRQDAAAGHAPTQKHAETAPRPAQLKGKKITLEAGETLAKVADRYDDPDDKIGRMAIAKRIAEASGITDIGHVKPGTELVIPDDVLRMQQQKQKPAGPAKPSNSR